MKILVNCSNLKKGGGLQVAHSFILELVRQNQHDWYVAASTELMKQLNLKLLKSHGIRLFHYDQKASIFQSITGKDKKLAELEKKLNISSTFSLFGPPYWRPRSRHICGFAKPQYIYKDSPFFKQLKLIQRIKLNIKEFFHLYSFKNHVDVYVTENENVSQRLRLIIKNKPVLTVTNTYNQVFDNPDLWDKSIQLKPFAGATIMTLTANYPHKNLKIIPGIIDYLEEKHPDLKFRFVISVFPSEIKGIKKRHLDHLVFLGKVNIYQCPFLYQQVDIMFLPTLLECFSVSYLEAMKMNVPIITTDLPFAREICGNAAVYFSPLSVEDAGEKIFFLSNNPTQLEILKLNGQRRLAHFDTPETRAEKYLKIITDETNTSII